MKLGKLFKSKKQRGKSKSQEQRFKEKKAKVDSFLLDSWLKQLRDDPALAQRIAEQKYGSEAVVAYGDGEYNDQPDLLSVLRQANEAKALLRDELGEGKSSTLRDIAEIFKSLPSVLQSLGSINPQALQQLTQPATVSQPRHVQIPQPVRHEEASQPPPEFGEVKLEKLMALLELEPQQAWDSLQAEGEAGWVNYLSHTSYEQLETKLKALGEENAEVQPHIDSFLKQKGHWLQELIIIAHKGEAKKQR